MEAHWTGASSDKLLDGLKFTPPSSTNNYVLENRPVNYFPESGNTFDALSSKVIRFRLADQGFLESSSLRLRFTIINQNAANLTPIATPLSMFRRARLFASGQLVEDITELANQATLRDRLLPMSRRVNNSIEARPTTTDETFSAIPQHAKRRVICNIPFGVLNQPSWLPSHLISGGLVIELGLLKQTLLLQKAAQTGSRRTSACWERFARSTLRWPIAMHITR